MAINAEVKVTQVKDGRKYKGYVHFGENWKFEYNLECDRDLGELNELANTDLDAAKRQLHLKVKRDDHPITIPEEIIGVFEALIYPLAAEFHSNSQTRGANETYVAGGNGSPELKAYGASVEIGMTKKFPFEGNKLELLLQEHFPLNQ